MEPRGCVLSPMQSIKNLPNYLMKSEFYLAQAEGPGESGAAKRSK